MEGEVKVVPIVIEALGAVSDMFEKLNVASFGHLDPVYMEWGTPV